MTNIPRPHAHMPVCHTVQTEHLYTAGWWTCTPSSPTALSATVPFCPILCSILFHPLTAIVCACSQPSHGPSGMPQSHQSRSRLVNAVCRAPYSSLRRAASLVRAHTAALPRLRLFLSHTASEPQPCCEQKTGLPLPRTWWLLRRLRRHARQFCHVLLCPCARPGEPSLLQLTPFAGAIHQGE